MLLKKPLFTKKSEDVNSGVMIRSIPSKNETSGGSSGSPGFNGGVTIENVDLPTYQLKINKNTLDKTTPGIERIKPFTAQ